MKTSGSTRLFIESIVRDLKSLHRLAQSKRNTLKIKCAESTLVQFRQRAEGVLSYIQSGGDIAPLKIQEEIYRPVVDYWAKELGIDEDDL